MWCEGEQRRKLANTCKRRGRGNGKACVSTDEEKRSMLTGLMGCESENGVGTRRAKEKVTKDL